MPLDRDNTVLKLGDEIGLQYYRLERVYAGAIELNEGDHAGVIAARRLAPVHLDDGAAGLDFAWPAFGLLGLA